MHVNCGRGSIFLRRQCQKLCIPGCVNDLVVLHTGQSGVKRTGRMLSGSPGEAAGRCLMPTVALLLLHVFSSFVRPWGADTVANGMQVSWRKVIFDLPKLLALRVFIDTREYSLSTAAEQSFD